MSASFRTDSELQKNQLVIHTLVDKSQESLCQRKAIVIYLSFPDRLAVVQILASQFPQQATGQSSLSNTGSIFLNQVQKKIRSNNCLEMVAERTNPSTIVGQNKIKKRRFRFVQRAAFSRCHIRARCSSARSCCQRGSRWSGPGV